MSARGMLFSDPMARAMQLKAKRQTRRVIDPQPSNRYAVVGVEPLDHAGVEWQYLFDDREPQRFTSPYGPIGQLIYAKERVLPMGSFGEGSPVRYRADLTTEAARKLEHTARRSFKPSFLMRKAEARTWARIMGVRVETVKDITEIDSIDEGVLQLSEDWIHHHFPEYAQTYIRWVETGKRGPNPLGPSPRQRFAALWNSLHGRDWKPLYEGAPRDPERKVISYLKEPFDGEAMQVTYRGKPAIIAPNPWVFVLSLEPEHAPDNLEAI